MDLLMVTAVFTGALILSVIEGISVLYALVFGLCCFFALALKRGFGFVEVSKMAGAGGKKCLVILEFFCFIGLLTAVWRACGTVAFLVYYGNQLIMPNFFILFCFLFSCVVSFLLGSSFATAGTVGVVLAVLANSAGVDISVVAGAVLAGAFFGDRCSPMSSSAMLISALTGTKIHDNVRNFLKACAVPLILSVALYAILSPAHPLASARENDLIAGLAGNFNLAWYAVLPAVLILVLAAFRADMRLAMAFSVLVGAVLGFVLQGVTPPQLLRYMALGYTLPAGGKLGELIGGGGLVSMVQVAAIVLIASTYSGISAGTGMLAGIEGKLVRLAEKIGAYPVTLLTAVLTCAFACNQTLAVILTQQLQQKTYAGQGRPPGALALDLADTAIVISPLMPWNIACAVPLAMLGAGASAVPYAFFLWLTPLVALFMPHNRRRPVFITTRGSTPER